MKGIVELDNPSHCWSSRYQPMPSIDGKGINFPNIIFALCNGETNFSNRKIFKMSEEVKKFIDILEGLAEQTEGINITPVRNIHKAINENIADLSTTLFNEEKAEEEEDDEGVEDQKFIDEEDGSEPRHSCYHAKVCDKTLDGSSI